MQSASAISTDAAYSGPSCNPAEVQAAPAQRCSSSAAPGGHGHGTANPSQPLVAEAPQNEQGDAAPGPKADAPTPQSSSCIVQQHLPGTAAMPRPSKKQQKQKQQNRRQRQRLSNLADPDDVDALLESVAGNEEQLVERLLLQLQGLSHKQQAIFGIADAPQGGRQAYVDTWRQRHADRRAMVAALEDPTTDPRTRMGMRTDYILKWRKTLFSCPTCWLLRGLCVCGHLQRFSPRTRVVVAMHHGEWGSASNSGSVLPTSLEGCEMLLYSHPAHDQRLRELLADPTYTTALLWPGADAVLPSELSAIAAQRSEGRLAVIALDATWPNARRMHGFFPAGTLTVRLPPESTLREHQLSLLRPVRKYGGDLTSGRVSTVEAVAHLLYELEGDEAMYRGLLHNLKVKVDGCRLQKNRELVYDALPAAVAAAAAAAAQGLRKDRTGSDASDDDADEAQQLAAEDCAAAALASATNGEHGP